WSGDRRLRTGMPGRRTPPMPAASSAARRRDSCRHCWSAACSACRSARCSGPLTPTAPKAATSA
ncbi:MAG: putative membrane protein, partial [uncultured Solirubrobacteraceae bacterium]